MIKELLLLRSTSWGKNAEKGRLDIQLHYRLLCCDNIKYVRRAPGRLFVPSINTIDMMVERGFINLFCKVQNRIYCRWSTFQNRREREKYPKVNPLISPANAAPFSPLLGTFRGNVSVLPTLYFSLALIVCLASNVFFGCLIATITH